MEAAAKQSIIILLIRSPDGGTTLFYRLKQIDFDGSFKYTNEVETNIAPEKFELFQNYPTDLIQVQKLNS